MWVEVVHNIQEENEFNFSESVKSQREFGFYASGYTKPVIWKRRSVFSAGLHKVKSPYVVDGRILLLHLRSVDVQTALARAEARKTVDFSIDQKEHNRGSHWLSGNNMNFFRKLQFSKNIRGSSEIQEDFLAQVSDSYELQISGFYGHDVGISSEMCRMEWSRS